MKINYINPIMRLKKKRLRIFMFKSCQSEDDFIQNRYQISIYFQFNGEKRKNAFAEYHPICANFFFSTSGSLVIFANQCVSSNA